MLVQSACVPMSASVLAAPSALLPLQAAAGSALRPALPVLAQVDSVRNMPSFGQKDTTFHAVTSPLSAEETVSPDTVRSSYAIYARNAARMKKGWARLIPNQWVSQFAGNIGAYSIGLGWHYGRLDNWETELLWGYVPRSNGSEEHQTLTLKQRFVPWRIPLSQSQRWVLEPLTAGLFANLIFGEGFWRHEPSKYTEGYYGFNTQLRYNIYAGQRIRYKIPSRHRRLVKSISFYYELSACDLYIVSSVPNRNITVGDVLSLALGLRLEVF